MLVLLLALLAEGPTSADVAGVSGLVDAAAVVPDLQVELKYATTDNFMHAAVYGDLKRCLLQRDAAQMLRQASDQLRRAHPELRLRVYDCARPRAVQLRMWQAVEGTPQQSFVADPRGPVGSIHNYGCAVDLTLASPDGRALDMGSPFDHFGQAAEPRHEIRLLREGKMSAPQVANRLLLREVMVRVGFTPVNNEWWHFNCASPAEARRRYPLIP